MIVLFLVIFACVYICPDANAQTWQQRRLMQQMQRDKQLADQNRIQQAIQSQAPEVCAPTIVNPQLNARHNPYNDYKNALLNKQASASKNMANYNGNQSYMKNPGTYTDGGSRVSGNYDGMGARENTGEYTRTMPAGLPPGSEIYFK